MTYKEEEKLLMLTCFCTKQFTLSSLTANRQPRCEEDWHRLDSERERCGVGQEREGERTSYQLNGCNNRAHSLCMPCHPLPSFHWSQSCSVHCNVRTAWNQRGGAWWPSPEGGGHQAIKCENWFKWFVQLKRWGMKQTFTIFIRRQRNTQQEHQHILCYHPQSITGSSDMKEGSNKFDNCWCNYR